MSGKCVSLRESGLPEPRRLRRRRRRGGSSGFKGGSGASGGGGETCSSSLRYLTMCAMAVRAHTNIHGRPWQALDGLDNVNVGCLRTVLRTWRSPLVSLSETELRSVGKVVPLQKNAQICTR